MTEDELDFHELAVKLLQETLTEVASLVPEGYWKGNQKWMIEASRILASNRVIACYTGLKLNEVNRNPDLGLTRLPTSSPGILELEVLSVLRKIEWSKQLGIFLQEHDLTAYELARLLAAIHEVAAYGKLELLNEGTLRVELDETEIKRHRGAFYTPTKVTRFICEHTLGHLLDERIDRLFNLLKNRDSTNSMKILQGLEDILSVTMVDPACGPGAFLIELLMVAKSRYSKIVGILKQLEKTFTTVGQDKFDKLRSTLENESSFLKYFQSHIYGVDLDPAAIEVASICLSFISGETNLKSSLDVKLKQGNSLISELPLGLVKPSSEELRNLLDLRERLGEGRTVEEKENLLIEFKKTVVRVQKRQYAPNVIRASQFFAELHKKGAFCWELEFPEVFYPDRQDEASGRFNILVMNPPYRILKLNRSKSGSPRDPREFETLRVALKNESDFFRKSGHYRLATAGVLNYYKLMIERALGLTSSLLGFIVPSTLLCDKTASKLRREVLNKYRVTGIFDFPERVRIFRGVSQAVCIVLIDKSCCGKFIPLASSLSKLGELDLARPHHIPLDLITTLSSDLSIPKVTEKGWSVLDKIHRNPRLSKIPWIQNQRGEVDLTIYGGYVSSENTGNRLVRGNHITRYILKWNPNEKGSFILKDGFLREVANSIKVSHIYRVRIAGQQVSNMMQRWRLKFCLVPPGTFLGNSCNYLLISSWEKEKDESSLLYLLALLNSCLLNWRFKLTSTNNHVSNYELNMLPIKLVDQSNRSEVVLRDLIVENVRRILQKGEVIDAISSEIEAAIFLLYGLTPGDVLFVLESEGASQQEIEDVMKHYRKLVE